MAEEEYEEVVEGEGAAEEIAAGLEEIERQYEERGFFRRLNDMFKGLGMSHASREYKLARIELQRLAAPLIAILAPVLGVIILIVVTAVSGQKKTVINVDIAKAEDPIEEPVDEPEPPDDIEPPPMEEMEITVDTPSPSPVTTLAPVPTPPNTQVSTKPAPQDAVAFVQSPVKMASLASSRTPGRIGVATQGGDGIGDALTEACVMKILW